ncbi:hypothetical protein A8C32_18575 [Flavivirga aquatica]|uniref:Secretion system C-terminal sorting domain-containing protein n=1 Tax=Flavivirga aquatica TaxID=1849968 RepID=A0A1E5T3X6_9FLAO|nr:T9SS type A sorting domain-containing protein [Flavivirga aquatica]OEK06041.1 hypothetical protein A8C32_18575 [Flavivirga aquatica]
MKKILCICLLIPVLVSAQVQTKGKTNRKTVIDKARILDNEENDSLSSFVRIYKYNGIDTWIQLGEDINIETSIDLSGKSISLSSNGAIIAEAIDNTENVVNSDHIQVYRYNGVNTWMLISKDDGGKLVEDLSKYSVSLSSNGNIVARKLDNKGSTLKPNDIQVYRYNGINSWEQIGENKKGESVKDLSGYSVSLSSKGNVIVIKLSNNGENKNNSSKVRVYNLKEVFLSKTNLNNLKSNPKQIGDSFNIKLKTGLKIKKINIYNSLGILVNTTDKTKIDASHLKKGIYYFEIETN